MAKGLLYILLPDKHQVLVIDPATEGIEKEINVNKEPQQIFFAEKSNKIFVTSRRPESLTMINPDILAIVDVMNLDNPPFGININPTERYYYITDDVDNQLIIIPIKAVKQERMIPTEVKPHSIAFTPNDRIILVTNEGSNTISIISSLQEKVLKNIEVGIAPTDIVVTNDGKKVYVANHKDRTVSVIDIEKMKKIKDITVGENPVKLFIISQ